ncbi:hypothetical protein [Rhodospirillum sp. A1_3_36]|uniref:hypothetical protein n=1 Tax=Rhodospirillum sp. A1_3_36 TaxID=3391666 RepID=UPI0039A5CC74
MRHVDFWFAGVLVVLLCFLVGEECRAGANAKFDPQVARIRSFVDLAGFPFSLYTTTISQSDIDTHERYRRHLNNQQKWLGDKFIYKAFDLYNRNTHLSLASVDKTISIGETLLTNSGPYRVAGYYLLGHVARFVTAKAEDGSIDLKSQKFKSIKARLHKNRVTISPRQRSLDKVLKHGLKCVQYEADSCSYLFKRTKDKIKSAIDQFKKKALDISVKLTETVPWIPALDQDWWEISPSPLELSNIAGQYPVHGGYASHYLTLTRDETRIGTAIWLKRPEVKAIYLAVSKRHVMKRRLVELSRSGARIVLRTTGGFSNAEKLPDGFTADKGQIVNSVILPDMDGLALVQKDGGIRLVNLRESDFTLPGIAARLNLRRSLADFATFLNWVELNQATVFQSQLLAYGNTLLIDPRLTPSQMRERRVLALARAPDGTLFHVLFDIFQSSNLADIAADLFAVLSHRRMKVEGMINLDVGSYNILECFNEQGSQMAEPKGTVSSTNATNLLVYFIQ